MINKKRLIKCLVIISLIIIIIFATIQIRKTLARYESTTTTNRDVDVAFWVVDNDFKSDRILIKDIYPATTSYDYSFSVSNFDPGILEAEIDDKIAETDIEYDIIITTTTNLPLNYVIKKDGITCNNVQQKLYTDEHGTVYREMKFGTIEEPYPLEMDTIVPEIDENGNETGKNIKKKKTDNYVLEVEFPVKYSANEQYADLMEDIQINLTARQKID